MNTQTLPQGSARWYRHAAPWLLMLGPVAVVLAGAYTTWLATRNDDGVVADDYYKRGLTINRALARDAKAAELGLEAQGRWTAGAATLEVTLAGAPGVAWPDILTVRLEHPTRHRLDRTVLLRRSGTGARYVGALSGLDATQWHLTVETPEWRLRGDWNAAVPDFNLNTQGLQS